MPCMKFGKGFKKTEDFVSKVSKESKKELTKKKKI